MTKETPRWVVAIILIVAVLSLWRSDPLSGRVLEGLNASQQALPAWSGGCSWLAAVIFSAVYIAIPGLSLPGANITFLDFDWSSNRARR